MPPEVLAAKVDTLETENAQLHEEVIRLKSQLDWFRRNFVGTGKSETLNALQTRLGLGDIDGEDEPASEAKQQIHYERNKAKKQPRCRCSTEEHFEKLPVMETVERIPEEVTANPEAYERISEERSFEVDITPPKLFKREIVRPKYKRIGQRGTPPVIAPALPRPAVCSYASAGLMAYVVWSKYLHHLPLYRQEKMSAHWGARLSRKSMADWVAYVAEWFEPIYGRMREQLTSGDYIQADETPVRFMDPDQKTGKTQQGYLWVIGKPGSDVVFDWRLTRRKEEAKSLLKGFGGVLQCDGYAAYNNVNTTRIACWAHVRRKFIEAAKEAPSVVRLILSQISSLYQWEHRWDERVTDQKRSDLRKSHFPTHLRLLRAIVLQQRKRCRPSSRLGEACTYLLGQWPALKEQENHGQCRIDNNLIENAIRPSAVGKKNFLFIGSPKAGKRSAIIYSIIVSCERHGIEPLTYMREVLGELAKLGKNSKAVDHLLPSRWSPSPQ